jgi:hypothetical protein
MAFATITLIGDRLHAINQTITGTKTRRYFPQNYHDSALHPLLYFTWGQALHQVPEAGSQVYFGERGWELVLLVGAWEQGLPTESMSVLAETLTERIIDAYITRPKLELVGASLDGVERAKLQTDTGLVPFAEDITLACVRFPLEISSRKTFSFNTE